MVDTISVVVTFLVFSSGILIGTRFRRRSRTFEFITQITITEPMVSESHKIYNLIAKYQSSKPSIKDLKPEELQTVMIVGSFYEFLGLSILQKLLNREVILLSRYAAMKQVWDIFEDVICERRIELNRKHLFGSFEKAVADFENEYLLLQKKNYPAQPRSSMWKKMKKLIGKIDK